MRFYKFVNYIKLIDDKQIKAHCVLLNVLWIFNGTDFLI